MTSARTLPAREDFPHFHALQTRWFDNDIYGHVNNTVYYSYFDTVINSYLVAEGGLDPFAGDIVGFAIETMCRFHKPLHFPMVIDGGLRVGRLGTSSVRYELGLFARGDDAVAADGHFVHVFVRRPENRPVPIPERMRAALERLAVG
jgi:acyl-CoA thioester hydrolase